MRPTNHHFIAHLSIVASLMAASAVHAQSTGAAGATAQPNVVQPSASSGQVGQPPQNSAMRSTSGGGQACRPRAGMANPMGMAGMGAGGSATNALTLSGNGSQGSGAAQ